MDRETSISVYSDAAIVAATQRRLDETATRAWERMEDARGTALYEMCRDLAFAAKDRADAHARQFVGQA